MGETESLLVITPSRLKRGRDGTLLLEKAILSIFHQSIASNLLIDVVVGIDPGSRVSEDLQFPKTVRFVQSGVASQAAALNAAAKSLNHTYLAILEDDDEWHNEFLAVAIEALKQVDFISSTQLQVDAQGQAVCIFDFPTPSGWVMRRKVWESIGAFNESYRLHLDNEWLGRLGESGFKRGHLIEATAPLDRRIMMIHRPTLNLYLTQSGPSSGVFRHQFLIPLVRRLVHEGSGLHSIGVDSAAKEQSKIETAQLKERFGRVPW